MGNVKDLSQRAIETIKNSEVLIGAKRMLDTFTNENKYISYIPQDISDYIDKTPYNNICVLMSGDTGFFSGTEKLLPLISHHNVEVYSGISSVSYLSSKIGITWNDSTVLSIHGRDCNYISAIDRNHRVFLLTGGNVQEVCKNLIYYNFDVNITIGENLSQKDEKISYGKLQDYINMEFPPLSTMYIENPYARNVSKIGIPDSQYIRGNVPMTKSEVRAISISKCRIEDNSICWDIGAGTGSVSVEMALMCPNGKVYAVERNHEGIELIKENCKKFRASNVEILEGNAETIVDNLPIPNIVFIGGSGGSIRQILDVTFKKNPSVRVVLNCITLETLHTILEYLQSVSIEDYDITQVSISHTNRISKYHMMKAENPVFVVSFGGSKNE